MIVTILRKQLQNLVGTCFIKRYVKKSLAIAVIVRK